MTKKINITQKLARLIPTIRKLHDSALEANIRLDQYVQENEKLRAFMENESEKTRLLNFEHTELSQKVNSFEMVKSELIQEREKNNELSQELSKLSLKSSREQDLARLQGDLSVDYVSLRNEHNATEIQYRSLVKKVSKKKTKYKANIQSLKAELLQATELKNGALIRAETLDAEVVLINGQLYELRNEIDNQQHSLGETESLVEEKLRELEILTHELETAKTVNNEKDAHIVELDLLVKKKLDEIDALTLDIQSISATRQEQLGRSHELESLLQEKTSQVENLNQKLGNSEMQQREQVNRLLQLENQLLILTTEAHNLTQSLSQSEQLRNEEIQRALELEALVQKKSDVISELDSNYRTIDTERQEYIKRLLDLENLIQKNLTDSSKVNQELENAEVRFHEQLNRSIELEAIILNNANEISTLNQSLHDVEQRQKEQVERSLFLEDSIQSLNEENTSLTNEITQSQDYSQKLSELQKELEALTSELGERQEELSNVKHRLGDSQHFANIRSEEALARILGKLSQIDFKDSRAPIMSGNIPLTNYSTQEIALGKYFDLLIGTLTGTVNEDQPISPWSEGKYDPEVRSLGRDWPATACSMIGTVRMTSLQRLVCDVVENDIPGDAIETGVWRGGACILMKSIFDIYGCRDRKVWVADSFEGLPNPNADEYKFDANDAHHTYEHLRVTQEQVAENFKKFGALDNNVKFLKGWFKDTLHKAPIDKLAILRLDGDMEESTLQALDALYHKVSKGGYVIVDDYGLGPCRKAVDGFRKDHGIESQIFEVDAACIYWQVE